MENGKPEYFVAHYNPFQLMAEEALEHRVEAVEFWEAEELPS
jgi:hypothetical protein